MHRKQRARVRRANTCPHIAEYIGNIFVLGLATLVGELVDLEAAKALDVLLNPFQDTQNNTEDEEILAGSVQEAEIIDLLDGLL